MAAISASLVKELRERTGLGMMDCKRALKANDGDIEKAIDELRKSGQAKAAKKAGRIAAEGIVVVRNADDNSSSIMVEINSETDFAARDENLIGFSGNFADIAFAAKETDVAKILADGQQEVRDALVQKVGENITPRRAALLEGAVVGSYVHGNNRIAVLVELSGGSVELARDVAMHIAAVNPSVINKEDMPEALVEKEKEIFTAQARESGKPDNIIEKMIVGRVNKFLSENSLTAQAFVKDPDVTVGQLVAKADAAILNFVRYEVGEGIEKEEVDFAAEVAAQLK